MSCGCTQSAPAATEYQAQETASSEKRLSPRVRAEVLERVQAHMAALQLRIAELRSNGMYHEAQKLDMEAALWGMRADWLETSCCVSPKTEAAGVKRLESMLPGCAPLRSERHERRVTMAGLDNCQLAPYPFCADGFPGLPPGHVGFVLEVTGCVEGAVAIELHGQIAEEANNECPTSVSADFVQLTEGSPESIAEELTVALTSQLSADGYANVFRYGRWVFVYFATGFAPEFVAAQSRVCLFLQSGAQVEIKQGFTATSCPTLGLVAPEDLRGDDLCSVYTTGVYPVEAGTTFRLLVGTGGLDCQALVNQSAPYYTVAPGETSADVAEWFEGIFSGLGATTRFAGAAAATVTGCGFCDDDNPIANPPVSACVVLPDGTSGDLANDPAFVRQHLFLPDELFCSFPNPT